MKRLSIITLSLLFGIGVSSADEVLLKRDVPSCKMQSVSSLTKKKSSRPVMMSSDNDGKVFNASALSLDSWSTIGQQKFGIYQYPAEGVYQCTNLWLDSYIDPTGGATIVGKDRYFWTNHISIYGMTIVNHYIADTSTWTYTSLQGSISGVARDLTWDHTTSLIYGCFRSDDGNSYVFGSLDIDNLAAGRKEIASLSEAWDAISVDKFGQIYAITRSGVLCKVDKGTGVITEVGATGITSKYQATGTIDQETGKFYYLPVLDQPTYLYSIDLATAEATPLYIMEDGEQLAGIYFPTDKDSQETPSAPSLDKVDVNHETLEVTVTFTTPTTMESGAQGSGDLAYALASDDVVVAEGKAGWGETLTVYFKLLSEGNHTLILNVESEGLISESAYHTLYAGVDSPAAISDLELNYSDGNADLQWKPSVESAHGGLFDKDKVTYTVVRLPEGKVVAEGLSDTHYQETVPDCDPAVMMSYSVTPEHLGHAGAPSFTESVMHGASSLPYEVSFDDRDNLDMLTLVDANDDGRYWMFSSDEEGQNCLFLYPTSFTLGDDYIFSAPVRLKAGVLYRFTGEVGARYARYGCRETVDLVVATSPNVDAIVVRAADGIIISQERQEVSASFSVASDGIYYIAIHACSEPDSFGLYAYGMKAGEEAKAEAPSAPAVSAFVVDHTSTDVVLTVIAPSTTINGSELQAMKRVELYRDNKLMNTFDAPEPATELTFTDSNVSEGLHVYTAYAYDNYDNKGGEGLTKAFIGINIPGSPTQLTATEGADCKSVDFIWKAPEVDRDGCMIDSDIITYTIASYDDASISWKPVMEGISETSATLAIDIAEGQILARFAVFAQTSKGKNTEEFAKTGIIAIGESYQMPYVETFGGSALTGVLGEENDNEGAFWSIDGKYDQDGDGLCLQYSGAIDKIGRLVTGKIAITGECPILSFWFWSIPTSTEDYIGVEVDDGSGFVEIGGTLLSRGGTEQHWERFCVDLDEFIGKEVQIRITYLLKKYILFIDNLRVVNEYTYNLQANKIQALTKTTPGVSFEVAVEVENSGLNPVDSYGINIYNNDSLIVSGTMPSIDCFDKINAVIDLTLNQTDSVDNYLRAEIVYDDDYAADNVSAPHYIRLIHSDVPSPVGLTATRKGKDVALSWKQSDEVDKYQIMTESLDDMIPFSTGLEKSCLSNDYIGDWTMYDGDKAGSAGLSGFTHDNIYKGAPLSFIVFNPAQLGIYVSSWLPRTGEQAFVCLCAPEFANDDWMISPELSGRAQTIRFYAKSVGVQYNEIFEVLSSSSGKEIGDFSMLKRVEGVPAEWTCYEIEVPDGTRYFAIRCVSNRQFALFVDDITFERRNPNHGVTPDGYNIYRDGNLVNTLRTPALDFVDVDVPEAHTYRVTAAYERGESMASHPAYVAEMSEIATVGSDCSKAIITTADGKILVDNAQGMPIMVSTVDGRVVKSTVGNRATTTIPVVSGVYVVRAGDKIAKVAVTK